MDLTTIDVTASPETRVGDAVTLLGSEGGPTGSIVSIDAQQMARLPIIFESGEALLASREEYRTALEDLSRTLPLDSPQQIRENRNIVRAFVR